MGAVCSCCDGSPGRGGAGAGGGGETYGTFRASSGPPTEADLEARKQAAVAAEARQVKFDKSPGGKAANKAIANVAKEREADAEAASRRNDNAKDWLS